MWADLSIFLALALGLVTAVPGLLPEPIVPLVVWGRVTAGVGWLSFAAGAATAGLPDAIVPGLLVAQAGYAIALTGIVWRGP